MGARHRRLSPVRRIRLASAVLIVAATAAAGVAAGESLRRPPASAGDTVRLATAPVVSTSLTNTTQVAGSLGFAGSYTISNQLPGTAYTVLPSPGQVVQDGQPLYEVDGSPVYLFYGARPEWRALSEGVPAGPDVAQLDRNLIVLGYAGNSGLIVSDVYTGVTAAAVDRWQAATGQPVTGAVSLGRMVYAPGPMRVVATSVSLGATPQPGAQVLTATSATPVVLAQLPVGQEYLVKPGDKVSVTLPDGVATTSGVVTDVSAEATASGSPYQGDGAQPSQFQGAGGSQATVQLTIQLSHLQAAGNLDQAPVTVNIVSAQADDVLAVPVNALVALAGGGYAVAVVHGSASHLVAVHTGLFTSALVQVSGVGLRPGERVQVPAP